MWIGDDDVCGRYRDAGHAKLIQGRGEQRRGEALAHAGYGIEGAGSELPEQSGALQEPIQFVEHVREAFIDLSSSASIANQRAESFAVLVSKLCDELSSELSVTGFGVTGGIDQAVGYATHGGDHDYD